MKKVMSLLFVAAMISMAACGGKKEETAASADSLATATMDSAAVTMDSAAATMDSAASAVVDSLKK